MESAIAAFPAWFAREMIRPLAEQADVVISKVAPRAADDVVRLRLEAAGLACEVEPVSTDQCRKLGQPVAIINGQKEVILEYREGLFKIPREFRCAVIAAAENGDCDLWVVDQIPFTFAVRKRGARGKGVLVRACRCESHHSPLARAMAGFIPTSAANALELGRSDHYEDGSLPRRASGRRG